jgi:hypothetical protein
MKTLDGQLSLASAVKFHQAPKEVAGYNFKEPKPEASNISNQYL